MPNEQMSITEARDRGTIFNPFTCGAQPSSRPDMSWKCEAWTWQSQKVGIRLSESCSPAACNSNCGRVMTSRRDIETPGWILIPTEIMPPSKIG
jgi:hypothetical protein